ncbi:MAG: hypothetical protein AAF986_08245 [Pseudomonadota bacterium]
MISLPSHEWNHRGFWNTLDGLGDLNEVSSAALDGDAKLSGLRAVKAVFVVML